MDNIQSNNVSPIWQLEIITLPHQSRVAGNYDQENRQHSLLMTVFEIITLHQSGVDGNYDKENRQHSLLMRVLFCHTVKMYLII
jgi:hypothetical protein